MEVEIISFEPRILFFLSIPAPGPAALNRGMTDVERYPIPFKAGGSGYQPALPKAAGPDMATVRAAFNRSDKPVGEMETTADRLEAQGML